MDPQTGVRSGPSTLSTAFLVLHALPLIVSFLLWLPVFLLVIAIPDDLQAHHRRRTLAFLVAGISSGCLGYAIYIQYYRKCRPWTGWFLFQGVGIVMQIALYLLIMREQTDTEPEQKK